MKLDFDIIRDVLLEIENDNSIQSKLDYSYENTPPEKLYAISKLIEAEFINAIDGSTMDGNVYIATSLTWDGHNFLNNIRENTIWSKTKSIANRIGVKSFEALVQISSNVISQIIINELNK